MDGNAYSLASQLAASICLIDEGSSSQALGMIRPLYSNVLMYWKDISSRRSRLMWPFMSVEPSHLPRLR